MNSKFPTIYTLYSTIVIAVFLLAYSSNPPNGRTNAPGDGYCEDCHLPGNPLGLDGELTIENFPSTIDPNTDYTITVRVTNPNGLAFKAGFQAVVLDGSDQNIGDLSIISGSNPSTTTSGNREYVEHSPAIPFTSSNEVTWDFIWTSPNGPDGEIIKMYAAGNIANGGAGNANDLVKSTNVQGTLVGGSTLTASIIFSSDVSCAGGDDGSAIALGMAGDPPYTYMWPDGSTDPSIDNLTAGSYTVTVTDDLGATATATANITEPLALNISVTTTDITCDNPTATASAHVTNGTAPYLYDWSSGGNGQTESGLVAGDYTLTVTDFNSCSNTESFSITEDINIPTSNCAPPDDLNCFTTSVMLDGSGSSSGPFITYLWSTIDGNIVDGQGTPLALVDQAGTYTLIVTDNDSGCSSQSMVTVVEIEDLVLTVNAIDVLCNGGSDGSIDLTVNGGQAPYDYQWNDANNTNVEDLEDVPAGNYCVIVTDDLGCTSMICADVSEPDAITLSGTTTDALCAGNCDGSIDLTVNGGTGIYTYDWDIIDTVEDPENLCAGTYTVTVTDQNGCTEVASFTVDEPASITISGTASMVCAGVCDGIIEIEVSGGTAGYTYEWNTSPVQNTSNATDLCAGTYTILVTDVNGCTAEASFVISENSNIVIAYNITQPSCFGGCDGGIMPTISGGNPPYTFQWSTGSTASDIQDICAGLYSVVVTDATGCTESVSMDVGEPFEISITSTNTNLSCAGDCNGAIDIEVEGGTGAFTYDWNTGQITEDLTGLCEGLFTVTVTDENECTAVASMSITEPVPMTATLVPTDATCNGGCDGNISMNVTGGTAPYTFLWTNNTTACDLPDICAGNYSVTITDANGCTLIESSGVNEPEPNIISGDFNDPSCFGVCDGSILSTVTGGTSPYSYAWNNGSTEADIFDLCAETYVLIVTDANGCSTQSTFVLSDPPALDSPTIVGDLAFCDGESTTLDAGLGYDSYTWNDGSTNQTITVSVSNIYCVTVSDLNGCTASDCVTVTNPAPPILEMSSTDETSNGANDGTATATVISGSAPFSFHWSNNDVTETIENLPPDIYCVTVTDGNGCTAEECINVIGLGCDLAGNISTSNANCTGGNDGTATINVSGGTEPYSYNWSNGSGEMMVVNLSAGAISVTATDATGCILILETTISEPEQLNVTSSVTNASCNGVCDGAVNLIITGGTSPFTSFSWSGPCEGQNPIGVCAGSFTVTTTDANGCTNVASVTVAEPTPLIVNVNCTPETAPGANDGTCTVSTLGGTPGFTEAWSNGVSGQTTISNLGPGDYCVTITDSNGCTQTNCGLVTSNGCNLTGDISTTEITCFGGSDGTATANVSGGTEPYSYNWSTGSGEMMILGLPAETYTVTVTDATGCSIVLETTLSNPSPISISPSITNPSCNGICDGEVNLTVTGGNSPYEYAWSGPCEGPNPVDICADTYTVTVTDVTGCSVSLTFTVTEPEAIELVMSATQESNAGANDGTATGVPSGGTSPYTYLWDDPNAQTTQTAVGLSGGIYCVTVTDNSDCTVTDCITVNTFSCDITLEISSPNVSCFGVCDASIDLTVNNGTAPFTYSWLPVSIGNVEDPTDLCPGGYAVTVTDDNGCTATTFTFVSGNPEITGDLTYYIQSCAPTCNDSIDAVIMGGTPPYSYLWSNGDTIQNPIGLCQENYSLTVTDATGCTEVFVPVEVVTPTALAVSTESTSVSCFGFCGQEYNRNRNWRFSTL